MRGFLSILALCCLPAALSSQQQQYDLLIRNGRIVDGTGSPWYSGDVAIRDGRIVAVGPCSTLEPARR